MWDIVTVSSFMNIAVALTTKFSEFLNGHNGEILVLWESFLDWHVNTAGLNPGQLIVLH